MMPSPGARLLVLLVPAITSCGVSGEAFCDRWVTEGCAMMAGCCAPGTVPRDDGVCEATLGLLCGCQLPFDGTYSEDDARACVGTIVTCGDYSLLSRTTLERRPICAPLRDGSGAHGSTCSGDGDCAPAGDFGMCWHGLDHRQPGVCVSGYFDESTCSYDPIEGVLRFCSATSYCTLPGFELAGTLPTTAEFSAPCAPLVAAGGSCVDPGDTDGLLPCQAGLYCHVVGAAEAACEPQKPPGALCDGDAGPNECAYHLECSPFGDTGTRRCQATVAPGNFCVAAPP